MNKKKLRKNYTLLIVLACTLNVFLLIVWFGFKAVPILYKIDELENKVNNIELSKEYDTFEELEKNIEKISKDYSLSFIIEDKTGTNITKTKIKTDISLFYKMVLVNNEPYILKSYSNQSISLTSIFLQLFIFEIIVVILILFGIFIFTKQTVFKPIEKIVNDIKNYKFGQKPSKSIKKNEFGLIKNEFVKLVNEIDEEKKEQTRIIANINHDIKTPLTSIIGYSDLLLDNKLDKDEEKKYIHKINEKAMHIKDILSTFDDYLASHEKVTLKKDIIQVKDLVSVLYDDYKIELENKNIKFEINTKIDNEYLNIDILKFKRIFANLITNSIRFLDNNGIITILIFEKDEMICFKVKDNGPGVEKDIITKIFDPLFTTDSSRKISGLGLSICKEFIEMHNGKIKAYNDNGLVIEFNIPKYIVK